LISIHQTRSKRSKKKVRDKGRTQYDPSDLLIYDSEVLEDQRTLADYNIRYGETTIHLIPGVSLPVKLPDGETLALVVDTRFTIAMVKEMIESKTGMPSITQRLHIGEDELLDDFRCGAQVMKKFATYDAFVSKCALIKTPTTQINPTLKLTTSSPSSS
jgi:hypothetical protein